MNKALVVIDVQQGLFDAQPRPFQAARVIHNISKLTAYARQQGLPIFFVQTEHPTLLPRQSAAWQLHASLHKEDKDIVVAKTEANAFIKTDLHQRLQQYTVDTIILCGYSTEFCVDSTLRYATTLDYSIDLVSDAHTTHDKAHLSAEKIIEHHNFTLSQGPTVTAMCTDEIAVGA